jgi:mono/diheme cytochrome c family protein
MSILIVIAVSALGMVGFANSGIYDASATSTHSGLVDWFLSTTSHASIERRAENVAVPDLDDESLVLAGINDFDSMCTSCHGAPGRGPEAVGQGLNPPAPDLAEEAAELTPAELFWVTKNGIRMTGMPAWGVTHGDDAIWPVVAFMKELPDLDGPAYLAMLELASGHGHHSEDATTDDHGHEESEESPDSSVHVHDDGSEHVHEQSAEPEPETDHDDVPHEHNDR